MRRVVIWALGAAALLVWTPLDADAQRGGKRRKPAPVEAPPAPPVEAPAAIEAPDDPPVEAPIESPPPTLDLLTVGPGDEVYTLYGHAAILVRERPDDPLAAGRIFNFGVTRWNRPRYVLDFLEGRVEFWGTARVFGPGLGKWVRADRSVTRRTIHLPPTAARTLLARMERDIEPEHREFVYDTFRDNCATRLRDYLDEVTGGAVYAAVGDAPGGRSFRDDVRRAYSRQPGLLLLTEIIPGASLDAPRTRWELMYQPAELEASLALVALDGHPLLGLPETLHVRAGPDPVGGSTLRGQMFIGALALVVLLIGLTLRVAGPRTRGMFLLSWALGSTALGLTLAVVWAMSDWVDMQRNWLLVAAPPLDLFLVWTAGRLVIFRREARTVARWWLSARVATAAGLTALTPAFAALDGPLSVRALATAGALLAWCCAHPRK